MYHQQDLLVTGGWFHNILIFNPYQEDDEDGKTIHVKRVFITTPSTHVTWMCSIIY